MGLTFKPDIDDLRESKALEVVETLQEDGYKIKVVEPNIKSYKNFSFSNLSDAIEQADVLCILVKHREFIDFKIKEKLIQRGALDFCGSLI